MSVAYVSYHPVALKDPLASSVAAPALYSDVLDFSSSQAETGSALTTAMADNRDIVALVSADDDCWIAFGTAPDCDAEAKSYLTSARLFLPATQIVSVYLAVGEKVAAKAVV